MQSFDIFDTVLTRCVGSPETVFLLLGKRLVARSLIQMPPAEFASLRVHAESVARRNCGWREVTFETIHAELAGMLKLDDDQRDVVMRLECEMEEFLLRVVPGAAEQVAKARKLHGSVIFISDMYLPRPVILQWLAGHSLWQEEDRLYLSNEVDATKLSGELFEHMLGVEDLPAASVIHQGNHPHGDVAVPLRQGLKVQPFPQGNCNCYETIMESHSIATAGLSSVLAGAARLARLDAPAENDVARTLRDVSAGVMAPILIGYVMWVLLRARDLSLSRLYFLSRDGQILLQIARRLAPKLKLNIELRYLYASRQSWHLPGIVRVDEAKLEWICMKYDFLSARSLFFRVGLNPEEIAAELAGAGLHSPDWDRQLTATQLDSIKGLLRSGPVHDLILSRAAAKRAVLLGYLRQEGLMADDSWALIDVGWNARLQSSLSDILASEGRPEPRGFYFALASRPPAMGAGKTETYFFDPSSRAARMRMSRVDLPTLLEIACAADHGMVVDFLEDESGFKPVLREESNAPVVEWGLPVMQDAICRVADHLALDDQMLDPKADLRPMATALMRRFWEDPTRQEAEIWGRYPFENDQSGSSCSPIARPYGAGAVLRALLGMDDARHSISFWRDGSIMISPTAVRVVLKMGTRMKSALWRHRLNARRANCPS